MNHKETYCENIQRSCAVDGVKDPTFEALPSEFKVGLSVNWPALLNHLAKHDLEDDLWKLAGQLSSSWVTCACGNQCTALPRSTSGMPKDDLLYKLGSRFQLDLSCGNSPERRVEEAWETLQQIEERSIYLLSGGQDDYTHPCS